MDYTLRRNVLRGQERCAFCGQPANHTLRIDAKLAGVSYPREPDVCESCVSGLPDNAILTDVDLDRLRLAGK